MLVHPVHGLPSATGRGERGILEDSVGSSNEVGDCKLPFLPILLNLWALYSIWGMVERDVIQVEWQ